MVDLVQQFAEAVARHPDRVAITDGHGRKTRFSELQTRARHLAAHWHRKGIRRGDRVLLAVPVDADLYASLAALWSLGATVVLPEPAMGLQGLRHAARITRPKALCASGLYCGLGYLLPELWNTALLRHRESPQPPPEVKLQESDIALISFTSGTTGRPKAIPRSHGFLMAQQAAVAPLLHSNEPERDLVAFPVFTLINLAAGRSSVLPNWKLRRPDRLRPARLQAWLREHQVTRALIPPSVCAYLADCDTTGPLHTVFTGGGPVFPDLVEKLRDDKKLQVICVYGSTEAEPIAHLDATEISEQDLQDMAAGRGLLVGKPVEQVQLRIRDHEIQVAGPHVNDSYLDPAQTAETKISEAGIVWHRTGDAGGFDDAGRLWLWGRIGTDVQTETGRLFPFAVETAARSWPGLRQAALVSHAGGPLLVVEGAVAHLQSWEKAARRFGIDQVKAIRQIPMDRRHRSKIDRLKLGKILSSGLS